MCNTVSIMMSLLLRAGTYKIPTANDIPLNFRVTLLRDAPCKRTPQAHSSKAVGEPPLFLGASVFFALKVPSVRLLLLRLCERALLGSPCCSLAKLSPLP